MGSREQGTESGASRERRAESREQRAESGERRAESGEQRAESEERRAESRERRAESGEQRAESGERRAESREQRAESGERSGVCSTPHLHQMYQPQGKCEEQNERMYLRSVALRCAHRRNIENIGTQRKEDVVEYSRQTHRRAYTVVPRDTAGIIRSAAPGDVGIRPRGAGHCLCVRVCVCDAFSTCVYMRIRKRRWWCGLVWCHSACASAGVPPARRRLRDARMRDARMLWRAHAERAPQLCV